MITGHIYITGYIGSFKDENGVDIKGVELIDVISAVQRNMNAEKYNVYIKSKGGRVDVGYNIYEYLKDLKQHITTIIDEECASIATVVAAAGEERIMIKGSEFMIHNPWVGGVTGDADDLEGAAKSIRAEEDKMINFYSELTGVGKIGLDHLMKVETSLTEERALELKFVTKVIGREEAASLGLILVEAPTQAPQLKAVAVIKPNEKKENKMSKEISDKLDKVLTFLNLKKEEKPVVKAMTVSDSNGLELSITKADGSEVEGLPAKGDLITVGGQPGEGSYILPDMKVTINAKAGVIESVVEDQPAAPAENPELEQAKTDLAAAQARVAELEATVKNHETFKAEVETKFALIEKGLKASHSNYVPQGRVTDFGKGKEEAPTSLNKEEMKKRKESYNNK
jgi:ATP-dependent Clp protease protease subunit